MCWCVCAVILGMLRLLKTQCDAYMSGHHVLAWHDVRYAKPAKNAV